MNDLLTPHFRRGGDLHRYPEPRINRTLGAFESNAPRFSFRVECRSELDQAQLELPLWSVPKGEPRRSRCRRARHWPRTFARVTAWRRGLGEESLATLEQRPASRASHQANFDLALVGWTVRLTLLSASASASGRFLAVRSGCRLLSKSRRTPCKRAEPCKRSVPAAQVSAGNGSSRVWAAISSLR